MKFFKFGKGDLYLSIATVYYIYLIYDICHNVNNDWKWVDCAILTWLFLWAIDGILSFIDRGFKDRNEK